MSKRSAKELLGLPIYSVAEGERLGTVSGLLVRREERVLEAVGLGGGAFRQPTYLRLSQLSTIGADAIMVPSASILREGLSGTHVKALEGGLTGRRVMSESGQRLGEVSSFTVETTTGKVESYRIRPESAGLARLAAMVKSDAVEVPDDLVVTLGTNALIVRDEVRAMLYPESVTAVEETPATAASPPPEGAPQAEADETPV